MNNIITRALTGLVFVITIAGSAYFDFNIFSFIVGLYAVLAMREFYKLISTEEAKPLIILGIIVGLCIYIITFLNVKCVILKKHAEIFYVSVFVLSMFVFLIELYRHSSLPFLNIAYTFFGVIYIAIPFSMLISFSAFEKEYNAVSYQVLGYFLILWSYDTFAYLTGMKFGKHRLFERISPKKSWEGVIGGALFAFLSAYLMSAFFSPYSLSHWCIIALIIIIFGTFGDLVESMLKRSLNMKDSGTILPGHGGILDRFDAVFISAPFVFLYLEISVFI